MPDAEYWNSFFDAAGIMEVLGCAPGGQETVVEFGSGYGTFTLPLARGAGHAVGACGAHGTFVDHRLHLCFRPIHGGRIRARSRLGGSGSGGDELGVVLGLDLQEVECGAPVDVEKSTGAALVDEAPVFCGVGGDGHRSAPEPAFGGDLGLRSHLAAHHLVPIDRLVGREHVGLDEQLRGGDHRIAREVGPCSASAAIDSE